MKTSNALLAALALAAPSLARAQPAPESAPAAETKAPEHVNAGFGNESFLLRSADDRFLLIPSGRMQMDFLGYQGGAHQQTNAFLPKRMRLEAFGTVMRIWEFGVGTELTGANAALTDAWINANLHPFANVQVGQFDAPFTMENRTSDKWTDLQERSVVARGLAIPENKQIGAMVWGQPKGEWAYWSAGLFNGEGPNQPHRSNAFDVIGRAWIAPFALAGSQTLKNVWVGGSVWHGDRDADAKDQLDRAAMTDQARFAFLPTTKGTTHTGDHGALDKWAAEVNAPVGQWVFKAEYVRSNEGMREVEGGAAVRDAKLSGSGYYARISYFPWGDPLINGLAGRQVPARIAGELKPAKTEDALQLVAEFDHVAVDYAGLGETGASSKFNGHYGIDTVGVGANYWYTRHVRLTANLLFNTFEGADARPLLTSTHSAELTLRAALAF